MPYNIVQQYKSDWLNEFPDNTAPPPVTLETAARCTSVIGNQVASLVNKTFIEAQLTKPVEFAAAVLSSCF